MLKKKNRILSIYPKKRSKDIFILNLDNGTTLEISNSILTSESIKEGKEIDSSNLENLLSKQEYQNLKNAGLALLSYRMRSKKELFEKLLAKNYDSTNIDLVLIDFEKNGWINDEEFGLAYSKDQINKYHKQKEVIDEQLLESKSRILKGDLKSRYIFGEDVIDGVNDFVVESHQITNKLNNEKINTIGK